MPMFWVLTNFTLTPSFSLSDAHRSARVGALFANRIPHVLKRGVLDPHLLSRSAEITSTV